MPYNLTLNRVGDIRKNLILSLRKGEIKNISMKNPQVRICLEKLSKMPGQFEIQLHRHDTSGCLHQLRSNGSFPGPNLKHCVSFANGRITDKFSDQLAVYEKVL